MKVVADCYECLQRLVCQASSLATANRQVRQMAIDKGLKVLRDNFSYDAVSIVIAGKIHKVIREVTQNSDPYREMKQAEIALAKEMYPALSHKYDNNLSNCLKLAASGNAIDFFRSHDSIKKDMKKLIDFGIDDSEKLEAKLKQGSKVMYLADNAGEVFFDLPLVKKMRRFAEVTYVVKASPVQDDATLDDIEQAGIKGQVNSRPKERFSTASWQSVNQWLIPLECPLTAM